MDILLTSDVELIFLTLCCQELLRDLVHSKLDDCQMLTTESYDLHLLRYRN